MSKVTNKGGKRSKPLASTKRPQKTKNSQRPGTRTKNKQKSSRGSSKKRQETAPNEPVAQSDGASDEDVQLDPEDIQFFQEHDKSSKFLRNLDPEALSRKVEKQQRLPDIPRGSQTIGKRKRYDDETWDHEQDYESVPRYHASEVASSRLPVKTGQGALRPNDKIPESQNLSSDEDDLDSDSGTSHSESSGSQQIPVDDISGASSMTVNQAKESLALLSQELAQNPEEKLGNLQKIMEMEKSDNYTIKQLALLTQVALYQDILPGYSIRPLTEVEKTQKVSKDVRVQREYEESLLRKYKQFIDRIHDIMRSSADESPREAELRLRLVATRCACQLLQRNSHFNFRDELVRMVIRRAAYQNGSDAQIACVLALEQLFSDDANGRVSVEAIKEIERVFKKRHGRVPPNLINSFLSLELLVSASSQNLNNPNSKNSRQKKQFMTKKARKTAKENRKIEKEMQEAEAVISAEERERLQSFALKKVFVLYLSIIRDRSKTLIGPAMEGLARYAHLINLDFLGDILEALRATLVSDEIKSSSRIALLCISTAFQLLSAQGLSKQQMDLDLSVFIEQLHSVIMQVTLNTNLESSDLATVENDGSRSNPRMRINVATEIEMLVRSVRSTFLKSRQPSPARLAAFYKRLFIACLQFPEKSSIVILQALQELRDRFQSLSSMSQSIDRAGDGVYNPAIDDTMLCNASVATIYEKFLLENHYSPKVQRLARSIR